MTLTSLSIPNVIDPGVRKHFVDSYNENKVDLGAIFKIGNQESKSDQYENYAGLAQFSPVGEGETYTEDSPIQAYGVVLTPVKFGKTMKVTYEMRKWAKAKEIWDGSRFLGRAAARTEQAKGSSVLINADSGSFLSMTDNKALAANDHPRADGGAAQDNLSTLAFGDANLETLILQMEGQVDDRGQIIEVFPDTLVIPSALRKQALQVLKSEMQSGTADNDVNVYSGMQTYYGSMKIVVWDYLGAAAGGSDTAFYLMDKNTSQLMWQWAEKANVSRDESIGFKQDVIYYKGRSYFSYGWRDWRGFLKSTGTV